MFSKTIPMISRIHRDEQGDIVQTAIIIGVLALIAIVVLQLLRGPLQNTFQAIVQAVSEAGNR